MSDVPELDAAGLPEELSAVRPDPASRRGQPAHPLGHHDRRVARLHSGLGPLPGQVRERVAQGAAAAAEGRDADAADRGAALGRRPRLQPRLSRATAAGPRARHAAPADRPRRGGRAVTAGHLPAAVDGDARRRPGRRPRRGDDASEPRRDRRRRRRRDVRQHLRPRARPAHRRTSRRCPSRRTCRPTT